MKNSKFLILCVLAFVVILFCLSTLNLDRTKISLLNSKYGLVAAEPLDYSNESLSALSYIFVPDLLKANVLDIFKPKIELLVKFKGSGDLFYLENVVLLRFRTNADLKEVTKQYESIDFISYAEPNFSVELSADVAPNSAKSAIKIPLKTPSNSVVVAVIDSGVDVTHKDLKNKIVVGYDFVSNDKNPDDNYGHGTHVAGIITKNSSAKIMPIKFTDGKTGKVSDLVRSIKFAVDHHADVVNLSLGLKEKSNFLNEAVDYASKNNIPVVAAAGNYNTSKKYYPAAYGQAIAVTALANDGGKLPQSDYGTWVDYSVKAQNVYSTMPGDSYGYATGTSQAVPFVSAEIAKFLENAKDTSMESILSELDKVSTPLNVGKFAQLLGREL